MDSVITGNFEKWSQPGHLFLGFTSRKTSLDVAWRQEMYSSGKTNLASCEMTVKSWCANDMGCLILEWNKCKKWDPYKRISWPGPKLITLSRALLPHLSSYLATFHRVVRIWSLWSFIIFMTLFADQFPCDRYTTKNKHSGRSLSSPWRSARNDRYNLPAVYNSGLSYWTL